MIKAVIFDLDGTLLDSLEDLMDSVNFALETYHLPKRTLAQIQSFIGNGVKKLVERSVPGGSSHPDFLKILDAFKEYYKEHCAVKTKPYPGILEMLEMLKNNEIRMAIASNKMEALFNQLKDRFFASFVEEAAGDVANRRKKPEIDMINVLLDKLKKRPEECLYVGDSEVDIKTAENAQIKCVAVAWGSRTKEQLIKAGAAKVIQKPHELLAVINQINGDSFCP